MTVAADTVVPNLGYEGRLLTVLAIEMKIRGVLVTHAVVMVTYNVTKMITINSPMI